jgi:hypothetical protein
MFDLYIAYGRMLLVKWAAENFREAVVFTPENRHSAMT